MSQNAPTAAAARPRARDIGLAPGIFKPGANNAITDVEGVRVGQTTVVEPPNVRTGVTAILPPPGQSVPDRVPAAVYVGNGFGKLLGVTQVRELGELETPILLTCTLCVWKAADAMVGWMLARDGMQDVRSINPAGRRDQRRRRSTTSGPPHHARAGAWRPWSRPPTDRWRRAPWAPAPAQSPSAGRAASAPARGCCPEALGGYTVGVLVQTNFGGVLTDGRRAGGRRAGPLRSRLRPGRDGAGRLTPTARA